MSCNLQVQVHDLIVMSCDLQGSWQAASGNRVTFYSSSLGHTKQKLYSLIYIFGRPILVSRVIFPIPLIQVIR